MEEKVNIAKQIAQEISRVHGVVSADVDDYNKYGNFQVVAYLNLGKDKKPKDNTFSLRKTRASISKILKQNSNKISKIGQSIDTPTRMYQKYSYRNFYESIFIGYDKDYVMIDFVVP